MASDGDDEKPWRSKDDQFGNAVKRKIDVLVSFEMVVKMVLMAEGADGRMTKSVRDVGCYVETGQLGRQGYMW